MDKTEKTYLSPEAGVALLVDEHVMDAVIHIMEDLHLQAGDDEEFDLNDIADMIHEEIGKDIEAEEDARLAEEEKKMMKSWMIHLFVVK